MISKTTELLCLNSHADSNLLECPIFTINDNEYTNQIVNDHLDVVQALILSADSLNNRIIIGLNENHYIESFFITNEYNFDIEKTANLLEHQFLKNELKIDYENESFD